MNKRTKAAGILGAAVLLGAISACSSSSDDTSSEPKKKAGTHAAKDSDVTTHSGNKGNPPAKDFHVGTVTLDKGLNLSKVRVEITNHTSKASDYYADVELLDSSGNRVDQMPTATDSLKPGKTFTDTIQFTNKGVKAKLSSADRTASQG